MRVHLELSLVSWSREVSCENDVPCTCGFVMRGNCAWSKREPSHRELEHKHTPTQIRQVYEREDTPMAVRAFLLSLEAFSPDVTLNCDPRDRGAGDLLQSPRLAVELLSPSTELKDRTWKLQNYTVHPTIEEYMLVSSQALEFEL
jgi:hypothetical protein